MNRAGKDEAATRTRSHFPWTEAHEVVREAPVEPTRVLLCGDQSLYRAALRILVQTREEFRIVAESTCEKAPLERALRNEIDLVLMDHDLCPATKAQLVSLATLLDHLAPRAIVIMTSVIDPQACYTALRHGACGIVLKAHGEETLLDAMASATRGQILLERAVLTEILAQIPHLGSVPRGEQEKIDQLTPREREIAAIACTGMTNKQIAATLTLSEATVRHHLGAVFGKLGVSTRSELAAYGHRHNLVAGRS